MRFPETHPSIPSPSHHPSQIRSKTSAGALGKANYPPVSHFPHAGLCHIFVIINKIQIIMAPLPTAGCQYFYAVADHPAYPGPESPHAETKLPLALSHTFSVQESSKENYSPKYSQFLICPTSNEATACIVTAISSRFRKPRVPRKSFERDAI